MNVKPHPQFLETLFKCRANIFNIFNDVLGLHEIDHIAITRIANEEIVSFSSTPALEFNLFKDKLWSYDRSYAPDWFQSCTKSEWSALYMPERYDDLYYVKQIQHGYSLGYALSVSKNEEFYIYSLGSKNTSGNAASVFASNLDDFYRIGQYCVNRLISLF
jgi:hypothetical protein